ncbi:MAG: beta-lactamase family protein [Flavobacteriales bacterium]|jgi:CubicO group peptidase (beta-lactamase class C family)|nr:beta-lactamase family protein [Flavobacteriales bacterium]
MKTINTLFFTIFFVLFSFAQTKSAQLSPPLTNASPASVGMSAERLTRIDVICEKAIADGDVPGMVVLVARNGKIVYHKAFGMADTTTKKPMAEDAIFRIASQTKAITATAVMMLWEEGKFRLDDPIAKYIPEFKDARVLETFNEKDSTFTTKPADKPITIRHLLTHTSGIGYGMIDGDNRFRKIYQKAGIIDAFTTNHITLKKNIAKLASMPLHQNPGEKFVYSEGLDVLGYFVEIISGIPFDQFLKSHIFEPLNMSDTWFYLPKSKENRLVPVYEKKEGKWSKLKANGIFDPDYPIKGAKSYFAGGAGLSSTAKDYTTFLQMYLNKGELNGIRFLSRTTVDFMMQKQFLNIWKGAGSYYALAFEVINAKGASEGGRGSEGTFDWGGYFNTQYFGDPKEQVIGIIMKQTSGPVNDKTGWQFKQIIESAIDD